MFNKKQAVKTTKEKEEKIIELTTEEVSEVTGGGSWSSGCSVSHSGGHTSVECHVGYHF